MYIYISVYYTSFVTELPLPSLQSSERVIRGEGMCRGQTPNTARIESSG